MSSKRTREDLIRESVLRANSLRDEDPQKFRQRAIDYVQQVQESIPGGYDPVLLDCEVGLRRKSLPDCVSQPLYSLRRR